MFTKKIIVSALCVSMLASCTPLFGGDEDDNPYKGMTEKQLYAEAQDQVAKEEYTAAAKRLEAMESMFPFSDKAEAAQLKLIYVYYKNKDYTSASATAERFIRLYPRSPKVDYAYYVKGLANFQQTRGAFAQFIPLDESWRDPGTQMEAYSDFQVLIEKFPNSQYRANAIARMTYLRNMFAQHELNTANYYMNRKMYVAAKQRAASLVKNYPAAPSVKEGLSVIYQASLALGLKNDAADAAKVFEANYHTKITQYEPPQAPSMMKKILVKTGLKKTV